MTRTPPTDGIQRGLAWLAAAALAAGATLAGCRSERGAPPAPPPAAAETAPAADAGLLRPVPVPDRAPLEAAVRERLTLGQTELDAALSRIAPSRAVEPLPADARSELGGHFGAQGKLYHAFGFAEAAEACYLNAQALLPQDHRWPYYLGQLARKQGALEASAARFRSALELEPELLPASVALAEVLLKASRADEAEVLFAGALERDPSAAPARVGLARIAYDRGQYQQAVDHYEAARRLAPDANSFLYGLGLAYRQLGERERAAEYLKQRGNIAPRLSDPLMEELEELGGAGARIFMNRGHQAYRAGLAREAEAAFRKAIEAEPLNARAHLNLGSVLSDRGDLEGAAASYRESLRLDPANPLTHFNLGTTLAKQAQVEAAIAAYRAALAINPRYPDALYNLGNALCRTGLFAEAEIAYGRAAELEPAFADARHARALTLLRLERWDEAAAVLEQASAAAPEDGRFQYLLARLLASCPVDRLRNGARALELAQAVAQREQVLAHIETLAMALAENGRFKEAVGLQSALLEKVAEAGRPDLSPRLKADLELYRQGKPSRSPWLLEDPFPKPAGAKPPAPR